jgi:hypothetical protein
MIPYSFLIATHLVHSAMNGKRKRKTPAIPMGGGRGKFVESRVKVHGRKRRKTELTRPHPTCKTRRKPLRRATQKNSHTKVNKIAGENFRNLQSRQEYDE